MYLNKTGIKLQSCVNRRGKIRMKLALFRAILSFFTSFKSDRIYTRVKITKIKSVLNIDMTSLRNSYAMGINVRQPNTFGIQ